MCFGWGLCTTSFRRLAVSETKSLKRTQPHSYTWTALGTSRAFFIGSFPVASHERPLKRLIGPIRIVRLAAMGGFRSRPSAASFSGSRAGLENDPRARRVEKARQLLETTRLPVSHGSRECGFKSVLFLKRFFIQKVGSPPRHTGCGPVGFHQSPGFHGFTEGPNRPKRI